MRIILDFDYTLFDTEAFRVALIELLAPFGVSSDIYRNTELEIGGARGTKLYLFDEHMQLIADVVGCDIQQLQEATQDILQDLSPFVFPDTIPFLQKVNDEKVILTFGDDMWQRLKVQASGIGTYVQNIYTTQAYTKVDAIGPLVLPDTQHLFIDDRGSTIDAVKQAFPEIRCIRLRRPGTPYYDEECTAADTEAAELSLNLLTE